MKGWLPLPQHSGKLDSRDTNSRGNLARKFSSDEIHSQFRAGRQDWKTTQQKQKILTCATVSEAIEETLFPLRGHSDFKVLNLKIL